MDRSTVWRTVGLVIGLASSSVAMAQSGAGGAGGDGTPLSQRRLEGRVVSVDPQHRSFQIGVIGRAIAGAQAMPTNGQDATDAKQLTVAPNAHIVRDGLSVPFAELRPGDEVRATFLSDDLARTRPWEIEARSPDGREAPWGVTHGE